MRLLCRIGWHKRYIYATTAIGLPIVWGCLRCNKISQPIAETDSDFLVGGIKVVRYVEGPWKPMTFGKYGSSHTRITRFE